MLSINNKLKNLSATIGDKPVGPSTGFLRLDAATRGFLEHKLFIVGARQGCGKSSLMVDMALAASKKVSVGIFSIEMPEEELLERIACNVAELHYSKMTSGKGTDKEKKRLDEAAEVISKLPIYYDDLPGYIGINDWFFEQKNIPIEKGILSKLTAWSKKGIKVFFIDHLHRMTWVGKETDKRFQMSEISRVLADYSKQLKICIVLLCQLRRFEQQQFKKKKGETIIPEPKIEDLKESGDIENNANSVILIHRPQLYQFEDELDLFEYNDKIETDAKLILAKNRGGQTGKCSVEFHNYCMSFHDRDRKRQSILTGDLI